MVTILDYDTGNLRSVMNALERLGAPYRISGDPAEVAAAERLLLPGVGEASAAMERLRRRGLDRVIRDLRCPVLGICLGMQLLCTHSEEGDTSCLGIFPNRVRRFEPLPGLKIPHIGWNSAEELRSPLFEGIPQGSYFYYVHSYAAEVSEQTIAQTSYGKGPFSGALGMDRFFGCQFHPEKSGPVGERLLSNFLTL